MADAPHSNGPAVPVPGQALDAAFAQLDSVAAQLRTPPAQARIWLGQWLGQLALAVGRLIGPHPWLGGIEPGIVTEVDTTTHRCTLQTGERPEPFPGVEYFPLTRPPTVGAEYAMRTARALGESQGALDASTFQLLAPEVRRRWIVVPSAPTPRWLYFRQFGGPEGGTLWRCQWPPTADAVVEQCQYVAVGAGDPPTLLDWHQGTGSIYAQNAPWPRNRPWESLPAGQGTDLERVPAWGFDPPTVTRLDVPERTLIGTVPAYPTADPAAVPWSALRPSASSTYVDVTSLTTPYIPTEEFSVSLDGGATFTPLATLDWEAPAPVTGGYAPAVSLEHPYIVGGGGLAPLYSGPSGFVLAADSALGPAGAAVLALPTYHFDNPATNQGYWERRYTTSPAAITVPSVGPATFALGATMAAPDWSYWAVNFAKSWVWRQAADGAWVVYRYVAGAIDTFGGTVPLAYYVGTGPDLAALSWRPLGLPDTTDLAPGAILAVSLDGQDVLAWGGGESSSGTRYYSTDAGQTWQAVTQPTLVDNQGDYFAHDDMLLVDIPADSPYAVPQEAP